MIGYIRSPRARLNGRWLLGLAGVGFFALSGTAQAHHSFAMFDQKTTLTFVGQVSKWEWTNPHSWIYVVVKTPKNGSEEWTVEASSPSAFSRRGGSKQMIKVGDTVTIKIHPRLDGQHGGSLVSVTVPDGRTIGGPGQPYSPAPASE